MAKSDRTADQTSSNHSGGATPETRRKRMIAMIILGGIFLVIGLLWFFYWLIWGRFEVYTDDAYVNGNMVQLMPQVPGTVIAINTDETQLVTQGQVIIRLDPADTLVALQKARAALGQTVRQVRQYYANAQQAQAELILRNADLMKAQLDVKRRTGLVGEKAVSREEMQHYQTAKSVAQAQYNATLHRMQAAVALVENSHLYAHPQVEHAKAVLKNAFLSWKRTTIVAPVTGYVAKRSVQVGAQVMMNTPMLAIVPLNQIWVDANYKESQLEKIRVNQPVTLYADAYPSVTYHGHVMGLNAGTGAAFALLPPQNATGNWIKIVQRLPVRISLDMHEITQQPLQLGLSMRVTVDIHDTKGSGLASKTETKVFYSTDVYARQLAEADELINQILKDNSPDIAMGSGN